MRTSLTVFFSLMVLSLASGGRAQTRAQAGKAAAPAAERPKQVWEVEGRGPSREDAQKNAMEEARKKVAKYLRARDPSLPWTPSAEYVRKHLVVGEGRRGKDEVVNAGEHQFPVECWTWTVTVTPEQYSQMVREDRREKAGERMELAAKVTIALVLLLAALAGYLRLDEWTQGYYTRWLLLALGGVFAGVGAGMILL